MAKRQQQVQNKGYLNKQNKWKTKQVYTKKICMFVS